MARFRKLNGLLLAFTVLAFPALAVQYQRESCETPDFGSKFQTLVANERAVSEAYDKIVRLTGTTKVSGCHFEVPTENGQPTEGIRRLMLDQNWHTTQIINGLEKQTYHQHGIKIEYLVKKMDMTGPGAVIGGPVFVDTVTIREVVSLQVCRTPESCRRLEITP